MPVQSYEAPPQSSKPFGTVLSMADAAIKVVKWVDRQGQESICLALIFGTETATGKPNITILADAEAMRTQLTIPVPELKRSIQDRLTAATEPEAPPPGPVLDLGVLDSTKVQSPVDVLGTRV